MPSHNLYQMMLNCEDWRCDAFIAELPLAARGAYIELLAAAWLTDDCTLPADEDALRRLARPDTESQWAEIWPRIRSRFKKRGQRLFNELQIEEFEKAKKMYSQKCEASKKGVEAKKRKKEERDHTVNRAVNQPVHQPNNTTHNLQPTTKRTLHTSDNLKGLPAPVGDIISSSMTGNHGSINELKGMVEEEAWARAYGFFQWTHSKYPEIQTVMDTIRNGADPFIREVKGCGKIDKPGAYLRSEAKKWAERERIDIPSDKDLNSKYRKDLCNE